MLVPSPRLNPDRRVLDLPAVSELDETLLLAEATGHRLLWVHVETDGSVRLVLSPRI